MTTDWNILEILAFAALLIVAARWLIALLNLLTGEPRPATGEKTTSEISVLVPARNEAVDLPKLLHSLQRCDQTIGEIIIYDDQSDDHTAGVARYWAEYDRRIRVIEGSELPDGWRGKNHACHQLAMAAMGKYLLFLDADVKVGQKAIDLALSRMKKDHLALFSFFPVQEMHTTGEWLLVAQVNVILVSLLPLAFSRYIPFNLVTAANGQFMMFDAGVYDQQRFHEKLRT
ncbi:MAG: glycosyltransferase family A protein, partial [Marinilabilia sp.]